MVPLTISSIGTVNCRIAEFEKITESFVMLVSDGIHLLVTAKIERNSRDTKIQSWLVKPCQKQLMRKSYQLSSIKTTNLSVAVKRLIESRAIAIE